ncbi:unnamed protein product [Symbiodinium sp. CCMP2592]|nr:unnamed protein product [Symbiodinium sp. CCMP2592]
MQCRLGLCRHSQASELLFDTQDSRQVRPAGVATKAQPRGRLPGYSACVSVKGADQRCQRERHAGERVHSPVVTAEVKRRVAAHKQLKALPPDHGRQFGKLLHSWAEAGPKFCAVAQQSQPFRGVSQNRQRLWKEALAVRGAASLAQRRSVQRQRSMWVCGMKQTDDDTGLGRHEGAQLEHVALPKSTAYAGTVQRCGQLLSALSTSSHLHTGLTASDACYHGRLLSSGGEYLLIRVAVFIFYCHSSMQRSFLQVQLHIQCEKNFGGWKRVMRFHSAPPLPYGSETDVPPPSPRPRGGIPLGMSIPELPGDACTGGSGDNEAHETACERGGRARHWWDRSALSPAAPWEAAVTLSRPRYVQEGDGRPGDSPFLYWVCKSRQATPRRSKALESLLLWAVEEVGKCFVTGEWHGCFRIEREVRKTREENGMLKASQPQSGQDDDPAG